MSDDDERLVRLLFLNAYLLRPVSLGIGRRRWEPGAAPAVADRADELGRTLAGAYDVVALSEVFTGADRDRVVRGWTSAGRNPDVVVGPPGGRGRAQGPTLVSSGLVTVADGPQVVRSDWHRFAAQGHRLADADPWAAKGVLLAELDVGLAGHVDLYSTHLCAGGGLLPGFGRRAAATDVVRREQAAELAGFVTATHRPENLVVVVGDMNVSVVSDGSDDPARPQRDLLATLGALGLEDLWDRGDRGPGPTSSMDRFPDAVGPPDPSDDRLADDAPRASTGVSAGARSDRGARIDRAFVERTTEQHQIIVRHATIRRRRLPRRPGAPDSDRLAHLSDHLGLHVELRLRSAGAGMGQAPAPGRGHRRPPPGHRRPPGPPGPPGEALTGAMIASTRLAGTVRSPAR